MIASVKEQRRYSMVILLLRINWVQLENEWKVLGEFQIIVPSPLDARWSIAIHARLCWTESRSMQVLPVSAAAGKFEGEAVRSAERQEVFVGLNDVMKRGSSRGSRTARAKERKWDLPTNGDSEPN
jgi:hypothetical protein